MSATTAAEKTDKTGGAAASSAGRVSGRLGRVVSGGRRRTLLAGVAVLALLALIVCVVVAAFSLRAREVVEADRTSAEQAARGAVERLLSYDSKNLDPTRAAIDQMAIGSFHDQFATVFDQIVSPNATHQRAKSQAAVRESGVVSADEGRVVVLLFLNQSTSSAQLPADRIDTIQTRVTMTRIDDRWLISALDQV